MEEEILTDDFKEKNFTRKISAQTEEPKIIYGTKVELSM